MSAYDLSLTLLVEIAELAGVEADTEPEPATGSAGMVIRCPEGSYAWRTCKVSDSSTLVALIG